MTTHRKRKGVISTNEIVTQPIQLPNTIEDLAKFILVGQEKVVAVRAEIRAIKSLKLAKDVEVQKMAEVRMLSEALLDAQVLIGEMTKNIPTKQGMRTDLEPRFTTEQKSSEGAYIKPTDSNAKTVELGNSGVTKLKNQIIKELGFDKMQVSRFETLADNKDLVEQVKQEARENDDIPTRTRVLDLAKLRKEKADTDIQKIDQDAKTHKAFVSAVYGVLKLPEAAEVADAIYRSARGNPSEDMEDIGRAIEILDAIRINLMRKEREHARKQRGKEIYN